MEKKSPYGFTNAYVVRCILFLLFISFLLL